MLGKSEVDQITNKILEIAEEDASTEAERNHILYQGYIDALKRNLRDIAVSLVRHVDFTEEIDLVNVVDTYGLDLMDYNPFADNLVSRYEAFPENEHGHVIIDSSQGVFCAGASEQSLGYMGNIEEEDKESILEASKGHRFEKIISTILENVYISDCEHYKWWLDLPQAKQLKGLHFIQNDIHQGDYVESIYYHPDPKKYLDELNEVIQFFKAEAVD